MAKECRSQRHTTLLAEASNSEELEIDGGHWSAGRRGLDHWAHATGKKAAAEGPFGDCPGQALTQRAEGYRKEEERERRSEQLEGTGDGRERVIRSRE